MTHQRIGEMGTIERTAEGVTVLFERHYEAPPSDVWDALTNPAHLAQWLAEATIDLRVGGAITVRFDDGTMNGLITRLDPPSVLAYTWHEEQPHESHVLWELSGRDGGTTLRLTHTKLPAESGSGFAGGWHHHLERLGGVIEGEPIDWSWARFEELMARYDDSPGAA